MKARFGAATFALMTILMTACEDNGNQGDDNLFTGGSLIIVAIIVALIVWYFVRRNRNP